MGREGLRRRAGVADRRGEDGPSSLLEILAHDSSAA